MSTTPAETPETKPGHALAAELRRRLQVGPSTRRWRRSPLSGGTDDMHAEMVQALWNATMEPGYYPQHTHDLLRPGWGAYQAYEKYIGGYRANPVLIAAIGQLSPYRFAELLGIMVDADVTNTGEGGRFFASLDPDNLTKSLAALVAEDKRQAAKARRKAALAAIPAPPHPLVDLSYYDVIVGNISGGKDSEAMMAVLEVEARKAGVSDRIRYFHADLGEMEWDDSVDLGPGWKGTVDLVERQAAAYGRTVTVRRRLNAKGKPDSLLDQVERRGMWPDARNRFCTSDNKRVVGEAATTEFIAELGDLGRPARILYVMGMRAQESCARRKMQPFELNERATYPTTRHIWTWLPIQDWTVEQVWASNNAAPTPSHPIYAKGMTRASCSFCILASKGDLVTACRLRPELAQRYADVETRIGHRFTNNLAMVQIIELANAPAA